MINRLSVQKVVCAFALFIASTASAQKIKVVTEYVHPLQFKVNGKIVGKTTQIVRKIFKQSRLEADIKMYPWARATQIATNEPDTLIYPMIRSPERENEYVWIGKILSFKLALITLKTSDKPSTKITHINDINSLRIGAMRDDYTHHLLVQHGLKEGQNFTLVSEFNQLLMLLYAGKIDTFIADYSLLRETATSLGYDSAQLVEAFILPEQEVEVYLAANKASDPVLIQTLKQSLSLIQTQ